MSEYIANEIQRLQSARARYENEIARIDKAIDRLEPLNKSLDEMIDEALNEPNN